MRWRPTTKIGMNHYVIEDDWYEGYFIPKNSVVILNQWALHYDEEIFPEPEKVNSLDDQELNRSTNQNVSSSTI
jgi:cytochrome P450